ncbi:uncharacterized protein ARB_01662 [Trichophyton benhamiae CBS 112371]|uniref:Uncharacterized protein n=1 Tax=Arthroderma benhamiae (strain ATCC MYA-4681 / CBS 112371) TaxID=663331 RepID=D4AZP4_ARTBC|nr:uncharacterized protein ARB_01662 [Trichophyton benhamiae CBS 112371]EFE31514.1 hypothetical protein ARB_01662 [Trichophyton benhamiae CBS 112371]
MTTAAAAEEEQPTSSQTEKKTPNYPTPKQQRQKQLLNRHPRLADQTDTQFRKTKEGIEPEEKQQASGEEEEDPEKTSRRRLVLGGGAASGSWAGKGQKGTAGDRDAAGQGVVGRAANYAAEEFLSCGEDMEERKEKKKRKERKGLDKEERLARGKALRLHLSNPTWHFLAFHYSFQTIGLELSAAPVTLREKEAKEKEKEEYQIYSKKSSKKGGNKQVGEKAYRTSGRHKGAEDEVRKGKLPPVPTLPKVF